MSDEDLVAFFTDKEQLEEISLLRKKLYILADSLTDFTERYDQMSDWQRCFTSWENERLTLSEKITQTNNMETVS